MTREEDGPRLRDAILQHLQREGSDSISGIARHLSSLDSAPVHRLTVAGYLAALADQGVLRETERPPSKHYQISDPEAHRSLHQRVGAIVAELDVPAPERSTLVVAVLSQVLGRPVFQEELHHAGYARLGPGTQEVEALEEDRRDYRALFRRRHAFELAIPHGDPLLAARAGAVSGRLIQDVLRLLLLDGLPGVNDLAAETPEGPQRVQTRLAVEAPE